MRPYPVGSLVVKLPRAWVSGTTGIAAPPYTLGSFAAEDDVSNPLVAVRSVTGKLRVGTINADYGVVGEQLFCMFSKCVCPPGKTGTVPPHKVTGLPALLLGLSGGAAQATATVTYHSLDEYCSKEDKPRGPAETNGDPHLTSLDGLHYDFQAAGEFVLTRSPNRDLEIQARQQAYNTSKTVTVNTQLALRVGGRRVTVSPGPTANSPPAVRVDGVPDALPSGTSRALDDGSVSRQLGEDGLVDVVWTDGSIATIRPVGKWGVAARIALASARRGKVKGLLGDFDGEIADDLVDRSGKRIRFTTKPDGGWDGLNRFVVREQYEKAFSAALYDDVGDAWRISQAESLFDYGPGQSTKTFTDRDIPTRPMDPDDIAAAKRATAERVCRDHGVTQPGPLADCITDVAATGNAAFADNAFVAQQAAQASWTRLRAGAALQSDLRLALTGDGALHVGFTDRPATGGVTASVPLDALGREGAQETIAAGEGGATLFTGTDGGARAAVAEIPTDGRPSGVHQYVRGAPGATWTPAGAITTVGTSYAGAPDAQALADGSPLIVAPMAGVARVFRGGVPGDPGVDPTAALPDCYATSPALARDGASGAIWVAWIQWDCPQVGVFVQQYDPVSGTFVGTPLRAPGGGRPDLGLPERLAFTGRPGQPGVVLAYPTEDGGRLQLWKVGDAAAASIAKRKTTVRHVRIAADGSGGRLWIAWREDDRLWVQRTSATGAPEGAPRPVDPPTDANREILRDVEIAARGGGLDVVLGTRAGAQPGGIWRTRLTP